MDLPGKIPYQKVDIDAYDKSVPRNEPRLRWFYLLYTLMFILTIVVVKLMLQNHLLFMSQLEEIGDNSSWELDDTNCRIQLVESIPENLNFSSNSPKFMSTYKAWKILLDLTNSNLDIGSFYWTMRGADVINDTTAAPGEDIFQRIVELGSGSNVKIRIAQSVPTDMEPDFDTQILKEKGAVELRSLNFTRLVGGGVLHTKFWISDHRHIYLGSANMDWRSLTQVKEMGVLAVHCPTLAADLEKIFNAYWMLGTDTATIPDHWPSQFSTEYNFQHPMQLLINNQYKQDLIFSSSPPPLTANGRVDDISAILQIIASAKRFVNIAVMDYIPLMMYSKEHTYWPVIDNALRVAAINRKIQIKLLISWWKHSNPAEDFFLKSLLELSHALPGVDIQIKRFIVPANKNESRIPFGRVNHNKYMVTDNVAYIGTSNWSGDYFTNTAGVGLVMPDTYNGTVRTLRHDLLSVFERDWNSPYAKDEKFFEAKCKIFQNAEFLILIVH